MHGEGFDALVIGGGINGVAIARELAFHGTRTLLVEQNDFASGTTSRSTRIIHGGLRYLEHGDLGLVRESLGERERLLRESPHLVKPLEFLLVLPKKPRSFLRSSLAIRTGLWLYQHWARVHTNPSPDLRAFEAQLDAGQKWSIYSYEDAQCEFPERMVAEWLAEALSAGAVVRNHTQALEITRSNGRATGARLRDSISGQEYSVTAKWVINATGPWADFLVNASNIQCHRMIGGVRGSHLVMPRFAGAPEQPVYAEAADGRQVFILPWNRQVLVGTTEIADSADPAAAEPAPHEIDYLYQSLIRIFPRCGLTSADIHYSFAGVRPLPYAPGKKYSAVTRRHLLHDHAVDGTAGLISIIGGKLTTAARLARDTGRKLGLRIPEPTCIFASPVNEGGRGTGQFSFNRAIGVERVRHAIDHAGLEDRRSPLRRRLRQRNIARFSAPRLRGRAGMGGSGISNAGSRRAVCCGVARKHRAADGMIGPTRSNFSSRLGPGVAREPRRRGADRVSAERCRDRATTPSAPSPAQPWAASPGPTVDAATTAPRRAPSAAPPSNTRNEPVR